MDDKDLPEFLKPRLRLFLSVDLVGSTALKQAGEFPIKRPIGDESLERAGPTWIFDLASFYREIEARFDFEWKNYCNSIPEKDRWPIDNRASLWKINGDELIYVQELKSSKHCIALLFCWKRACQSYRKDILSKMSKLDVKMTAWTAGFPLTNTEVIFERDGESRYEDCDPLFIHYDLLKRWYSESDSHLKLIQDFIGPSIDTGFRIASKATPRKFIVSIEVAFIIAVTNIPKSMEMKLFFSGHESLKGVFGGRPYPIFWIDTHSDDQLSRAEDKLTNITPLVRESVQEYCECFFEGYSSYMIKPFINTDMESMMTAIPPHYEEKLRYLAEKCRATSDDKITFDKSFEAQKDEIKESAVELRNIIIDIPKADSD